MRRLGCKPPALTLSFCLAVGCATSAPKDHVKAPRGGDELTFGNATNSTNLSDSDSTNVIATPGAPPPAGHSNRKRRASARQRKARPATRPQHGEPSATSEEKPTKACQVIFRRLASSYQALFQKMPQGDYLEPKSAANQSVDPFSILLNAKADDCKDKDKRQQLVAAVVATVSQHSGKIGVILPLSGRDAKVGTYIVNGMRDAMQEIGLPFANDVIVKDGHSDNRANEQALAELIYKDKVSLIIGGLEPNEATLLAKWSDTLMVPMLLLTRERNAIASSRFAFRVYPDEKRLATTLAAGAKKRGYKRLAIVRPNDHRSDNIAAYFRAAVEQHGGTIVHDIMYTPNNFDSMQAVGRQLFRIDTAARADEYRQAYQKARTAAELAHQPFDPRQVVLKAIVDFDAVFIPDDFRTVRHFAKLFRYHGVEHLPLIGNHEWRSPALVQPYDDFLEGSFFADFIGSYTRLPRVIKATTLNSPYFILPEQVMSVDFQLIGYRAAKIAARAATAPHTKRRHLGALLARLQGGNSPVGAATPFFGQGPIFDAERNSNWPTYLFTISKGQIVLDNFQTAVNRVPGGS